MINNMVHNYIHTLDFKNPDSVNTVSAWASILKRLEFINSLSDEYYSGVDNTFQFDRGLFAKTPLRIAASSYLDDLFGGRSMLLATSRILRKDTLKYNALKTELALSQKFNDYGFKTKDPTKGWAKKGLTKSMDSVLKIAQAGVIGVIVRLLFSFLTRDEDEKNRMLNIINDLAGKDFGRGFMRMMAVGVEQSAIVYTGFSKTFTGSYEAFKFLTDLANRVNQVASKVKDAEQQESAFGAARELVQLILAGTGKDGIYYPFKLAVALNGNLNKEGDAYFRQIEDVRSFKPLEMAIVSTFFNADNISKFEDKAIKDPNDKYKDKPILQSELERVVRDFFGVKDRKEKEPKSLKSLVDDTDVSNRKDEVAIESVVKNVWRVFDSVTNPPENQIKEENRLPDSFPKDLKQQTEKMIQSGTLTKEQAISLANKNVLGEKKLTAVSEYIDLNNQLYTAKAEGGDDKKVKDLEQTISKLKERDKNYAQKIGEIKSMGYDNFESEFGKKQLTYTYDDKQNTFKIGEKKKQDTAESLQADATKKLFDQSGGKGGGRSAGGGGGGKIGNSFGGGKMKALKPNKVTTSKPKKLKKAKKPKKIAIKKSTKAKSSKLSVGVKGATNRISSGRAVTVKTPSIKFSKLSFKPIKPIKFKSPKLSKIRVPNANKS
jgi:hypothetical protein